MFVGLLVNLCPWCYNNKVKNTVFYMVEKSLIDWLTAESTCTFLPLHKEISVLTKVKVVTEKSFRKDFHSKSNSCQEKCSTKKLFWKNFTIFLERQERWILFLVKSHGNTQNVTKKRLHRTSFPVNFGELFWTPVLRKTCERMLLNKIVLAVLRPGILVRWESEDSFRMNLLNLCILYCSVVFLDFWGGVFKTQSNIYIWAFLQKKLTVFSKNLDDKCLTGI